MSHATINSFEPPTPEYVERVIADLTEQGVRGVQIAWADNASILRARVIPLAQLRSVARKGIGITPLFAVFNTYDQINTDYHGQTVPDELGAEVRLVPVLEHLQPLSEQPTIAFTTGRILTLNGDRWAYDPRSVLERVTQRAADAGYTFKFGYEIEFFLGVQSAQGEVIPAHSGPAYSFNANDAVSDFIETVLADAETNGLRLAQIHAEYGLSQLELSTEPLDPVATADQVLLARVTLHQAAAAHGLTVSFSPLLDESRTGNGTHVHTSIWRDGKNLLSASTDDTSDGPSDDDQESVVSRLFTNGTASLGAQFVAGLVEHLPAISSVGAPSLVSFLRRRPGYFAGAYQFWGVENREASVRFIQESPLLGAGHANVEVKPLDITGNPYLTIAAIIAGGLDGIAQELTLAEPLQVEPGTLDAAERERLGVELLPTDIPSAVAALRADAAIVESLGQPLVDALSQVRETDLAWADDKPVDDVIAAQLWRY